MQHGKNIKTTVALVGAGPGDPELLTLKAARLLREAEVVITDRLVSEEILKAHVSEGALVIFAGKQCRRGKSTPQETINELIVEHALAGKKVVRLKGGDVSIFSNVLDELLALKAYGIAYEIVPGITAALGAAAYAGMPLTAREHSTAVRLLTYYKKEILSDAYWAELAQTEDTLVFYMSGDTSLELIQKLIAHKIPADRAVAVIEQATTPLQQVRISDIYDYEQNLGQEAYLSPALLIIGKVVHLHKQFAWLPNSASRELYFKPVGSQPRSVQASHIKQAPHVSRA